jgi:hypothetical protein
MGRFVMQVRLRDRSGNRHYRFVVEDVDRHGNVRVYFRRKGQRKIRFTETPGTDEFEKEYQRAFCGEAVPAVIIPRCPGLCVGCGSNTMLQLFFSHSLRAPAKCGAGSLTKFASAPAISDMR